MPQNTIGLTLCVVLSALPLLITAELSITNASTCEEPAVQGVCECGHWSRKGYQCSKCTSRKHWGYGCDLKCPDSCQFSCDFLGNCNLPGTCKRNNRIDKNTNPADSVKNERGECQACEKGFHGLHCSKRCPKNCDLDGPERGCTRAGKCYRCKAGWYGRLCDKQCPSSCPKCVFDDMVTEKDGQWLPAGSCKEQCTVDKWGPACDQSCPDTCKKSHTPSCRKENGFCNKCHGHIYWGDKCEKPCSQGCSDNRCHKDSGLCEGDCLPKWYGEKCENECSEGCKDGLCDKIDGTCDTECVPGYYGLKCNVACPAGTGPEGCDKDEGRPKTCVEGKFPDFDMKRIKWICRSCSDNCLNHKCNNDGQCTEGCLAGFFGPECRSTCAAKCDGPCDATATGKTDGWCKACQAGFTGKKCTKSCHTSCSSCQQHGGTFSFGDGTAEDMCSTCRLDEPSILTDGKCECIEGASRGEDGRCVCDEPEGDKADMKMARFELKPAKVCRFICKEGFREVFGNKESICLTNKVYKAVVRAEILGLKQGTCAEGENEIPVKDEEPKCIRADFVDYVVRG